MSPLPPSQPLLGPLLTAGLVLGGSPARAIGTTFSFDLGSSTASPAAPLASPSKAFTATANGQTLQLVFQNALLPNGNAKPVSATDEGLCLYKAGGAGLNNIGRTNCGRANPGNGNGARNQNAIELFFDQQVELLSYRYGSLRVGRGNPLLTWGAPISPMVSTETLFDKQVDTSYTFSNPFIIQANQIITITGTGGGRGSSTTEALLSHLFGAMAAFGWSRRLRSRLSSTDPVARRRGPDGSQA
jgi:hypothetical protein